MTSKQYEILHEPEDPAPNLMVVLFNTKATFIVLSLLRPRLNQYDIYLKRRRERTRLLASFFANAPVESNRLELLHLFLLQCTVLVRELLLESLTVDPTTQLSMGWVEPRDVTVLRGNIGTKL